VKKAILSFFALAAGATIAFAGPVEDREAIMKERAGLLRQITPMARGQEPYDAARAQQILDALAANAMAKTAAELFPESSGEGTEASPRIWEDFPAYQAEWDKYTAATTSAATARPQDQASLQTQLAPVGASCGSCHQNFRVSN